MALEGSLRVQVLAFHDCAPIVPVGVLDLLRKSIDLASTLPSPKPRRRIELALVAAGERRTVKGAGGLALRCDATFETAGRGDVVVVPALDPDVLEHLRRNGAVLPWLRRSYERGADIMSACTGAFALAEAGLLDGRMATTHWAFQALLAERHPRVRLAPHAVLVDQGRVVTAGGATSFLTLALFLVERLLGQEVAWTASRMFLIDPNKSPQGAYAMFSTQKAHGDDRILRAQAIVEGEVARAPAVEELARRVALSQRTFVRRFRSATGNTPRDYIQRVRVEAAKRALEHGEDSVTDVAGRVGYGDVVAFRKVFVRLTGLTPAEYRSRYGPKAAPTWVLWKPSGARQGAARSTARR
jgi:transcriptional regulator GlxA family with amidase domain